MEALQTGIETKVKPVGTGTVDYSQEAAPVLINSAWCKGCDICSALCPRCVLEPDRNGKPIITRPRECTQCGMCWTHCPDFAITSNSSQYAGSKRH
jgi:2-oxoglutarate ferredoxin oxidoreductase subunit delta